MKKLKAFTLVEMLIVMGILAILMTIGISVGRFAIQRSNNIQHQSAVDQIGLAVQSYYTDNRRYPDSITAGSNPSEGVLDDYIDASFDGGAPATFYYDTSQTNQAYIACVTFGGLDDTDELGVYCTGDGFEDPDVFNGAIGEKNYDYNADLLNTLSTTASSVADWDGGEWTVQK